MSHSYHHYRQVKVIRNSRHSSPEIDGFEEIVCDGKRQVYYLNNQTGNSRWYNSDFLFSPLINQEHDWLGTGEFSHHIRYLDPQDVVISNLTDTQTKVRHKKRKLSQIKTSIQQWITNVKKMTKRLPLALKAAWRELQSDD